MNKDSEYIQEVLPAHLTAKLPASEDKDGILNSWERKVAP